MRVEDISGGGDCGVYGVLLYSQRKQGINRGGKVGRSELLPRIMDGVVITIGSFHDKGGKTKD